MQSPVKQANKHRTFYHPAIQADRIGERSSMLPTPSACQDVFSPGTYKLSIAVVGEKDTEPVVQLGIEGRAKDGWYPLSTVTISK